VLAIAGGAAALAALAWSKDWIVRMMPHDLPRLAEVQFDGAMVVTALAQVIASGHMGRSVSLWNARVASDIKRYATAISA